MKKNLLFSGVIIVVLIAVGYMIFSTNLFIPKSEVKNAAQSTEEKEISSGPIYENSEYGFKFSMPSDWGGYKAEKESWTAGKIDGEGNFIPNVEQGPKIVISHPRVSDNNEIIPVWILTKAQWSRKDVNYNGAAPVEPTVLGQNEGYVFLLPPRYNFGFNPSDVEEIIAIDSLLKSSFQAF